MNSDDAGLDAVVHASERASKLAGCLLGGALGDAVGLAQEGLGPRRIEKRFPDLDGPRLLGRRGMISDDTEHALFTARALFLAQDDVEKFALLLQRELKTWLLSLPAGAGAATIKAAIKSWRGASPDACGVDSAGNGPAMRAPIIGLWASHDENLLCALNRASSRLTHTDSRAEAGALCVALAARDAALGVSFQESATHITSTVRAWMSATSTCSEEVEALLRAVQNAAEAAHEKVTCWDFARSVVGADFERKGVSGFISHTVPVALHAAWREDDARESILNAVRCGGDTDSVAAIAGAIVGARVGAPHLPQEWMSALFEWPRGVAFMEQAAQVLAARREAGSAAEIEWPRANFASILARNVFFLSVVLAHGLRRLAPPY
jgi:ADP-ribosyl-[dinitrogen reductase] hydrolase